MVYFKSRILLLQ